MTLVLAAGVSHGPGITGRAERADPELRDGFYAALEGLRRDIEAARLDALVLVTAEHFANFFANNMPAFCIGIGEDFHGPIEAEAFLRIRPTVVPGAPALARALAESAMQRVDLAFSEEMAFDHGAMVPLHFLTPAMDTPVIPVIVNCLMRPLPPLARCWELGRALRDAIDARPERIALLAAGGISHWPATPESGRINEAWDRAFLNRLIANDRAALVGYGDAEIESDAGPGGQEIRAYLALAGATEDAPGTLRHYQPIPIFAVGCTVVTKAVA